MEIIRQEPIPPVFRLEEEPSVSDWIERLKKEGVTLEILVLLVMSNKKKTGTMDRAAQSISDIVEEVNELSKLQDALIKLNGDLSKLEGGLGNIPSTSKESWKTNKMEELIQKIADDYKQFIKDLAEVEKKGEKDPSLKALLTTVEQFKADFDVKIGGESFFDRESFSEAIEQWVNDTDYHGNDTGFHPNAQGKDPILLNRILAYLAEQYYQSNHSGGTDKQCNLANFWMDGSASQHMVTGQSQQQSIQIQAYMQTLNGYNNTAQEMIKIINELKSKLTQLVI
ncbi:MAG: hypothetical protein ACH349_05675 [Candidatus Rhabdochlamydia sp.]|jgi:hypothetical protein|nr:hypothetical protein [Chlamydiota bacterium]